MADDYAQEFANRAAMIAVDTVQQDLIQAQRDYEDSVRAGDEALAGDAFNRYNKAKIEYDNLTGANRPQQQQQPQLSPAAQNYLSRRVAGGDQLTPQRWQDYIRGHVRAVNAGLQADSPEYFAAVSHYCDHLGDGRIPPLTESEVAKMCGISDEEYAIQAHKLRQLKRAGHYGD
jgi:hypothetical protein